MYSFVALPWLVDVSLEVAFIFTQDSPWVSESQILGLRFHLFIFNYVCECVSGEATAAERGAKETRGRHRIPWNWHYGWW